MTLKQRQLLVGGKIIASIMHREFVNLLCCLRNFNGMEKLMDLMEMRFNPSRVDGQTTHRGTTTSLMFITHISGSFQICLSF